MFNKIRYVNKINIKLRGCFEILESFGGERVNKIRFDGRINKEIRSVEFLRNVFGKGENQRREEKPRESCDFA